jgi:D-tyrosyl-tRNA(Tyr) deacylase
MRLVVQRVTSASVSVDGQELGRIGLGALVLVGIASGDTPDLADRMADKLLGMRYFEDAEGRTNAPIEAIAGSFLVISQFTLLADLRRGRRPGFTRAAAPELGASLVDRFVERLRGAGQQVEVGRFGASMEVTLVNHGPFTLVLDSEHDLAG